MYQRSGGIAGASEQWTIQANGRVVSAAGDVFDVSAERVAQLLGEIDRLGFFDLPAPDSRFGACRDCFIYQIRVSRADEVRSVTFVDGAPETPPEFQQAASLIEAFLSGIGHR